MYASTTIERSQFPVECIKRSAALELGDGRDESWWSSFGHAAEVAAMEANVVTVAHDLFTFFTVSAPSLVSTFINQAHFSLRLVVYSAYPNVACNKGDRLWSSLARPNWVEVNNASSRREAPACLACFAKFAPSPLELRWVGKLCAVRRPSDGWWRHGGGVGDALWWRLNKVIRLGGFP